jgi:hypothetical protein
MSLKFNNNNKITTSYRSSQLGIPFASVGTPNTIPSIQKVFQTKKKPNQALQMPGANLKRALNYYADYGGCGFWRMIWPETLINGYQKAIVNGLTTMVLDPRFYAGYSAVRLQRQATPMQLKFVEFLKSQQSTHDFKIIYEIDDIIFKDDIPDFNKCKVAFDNDEILQSTKEIMAAADEISVTCDFMKNYYMEHTSNKNISVIPNYTPRFWFQGLYDKQNVLNNLEKNKKQPRVGYCGSGTHIDVANKTNQKDDFGHVTDYIIATRKKFKWVFMGCYPLKCKPFIDSGEIEYHNWNGLYTYPTAMKNLNVNAFIAPLQDNTFNKAKSNIKYLEPANLGIPCFCQDIITYKAAPDELRFTTGQDLIDKLNMVLSNPDLYSKLSDKVYEYSQNMQLDDHLDEYCELYFTKYGSSKRKLLK